MKLPRNPSAENVEYSTDKNLNISTYTASNSDQLILDCFEPRMISALLHVYKWFLKFHLISCGIFAHRFLKIICGCYVIQGQERKAQVRKGISDQNSRTGTSSYPSSRISSLSVSFD